jgi:hypothetical protein
MKNTSLSSGPEYYYYRDGQRFQLTSIAVDSAKSEIEITYCSETGERVLKREPVHQTIENCTANEARRISAW